MADYRRILWLLLQGRSYREIAAAVGCSHRDVATARRVLGEEGLTAERLADMPEAELMVLFPDGRSRVSEEYASPDFSRVVSSMRHNPHFTLLQAWRSYVGSGSGLSWLTVWLERFRRSCGWLLSRSCLQGDGGGLGRVSVGDHGVELRASGLRPGLPGGQGGGPAVHVDVVRGQRVTAIFGP